MGKIGEGDYDDSFKGADAIYRYWDATQCVELGFDMAEEALEKHLSAEVQMLQVYDYANAILNDEFDVRGSTLSELIFGCIEHGSVSSNKRKKYVDAGKPELFDRIEDVVRAALQEHGSNDGHQGDELASASQPRPE